MCEFIAAGVVGCVWTAVHYATLWLDERAMGSAVTVKMQPVGCITVRKGE